jgi:N-hydroxyarylamine O-acetyltransferase
MEGRMDIDAYFERIGYRGSAAPTLATLHDLTLAHTSHIPFENLDVLLGRPIDLAPEALFQKLVHQKRGGYCFEQNGLFLAVLGELGFRVAPLSARVRIDRPRDFLPPRTHVFVRVELEGQSWLSDVGVGALSLTSAIRLCEDLAQDTRHEPRRIVREDGRLFHQVKLGDAWSDVCEFTLEEMPLVDRELGNWYTSAHPKSHFKSRLIAARAADNGTRLTLLNDELKVRGRDGHAEVTKITGPEHLLLVLREQFGLHFPAETRFGPPGSPWPA